MGTMRGVELPVARRPDWALVLAMGESGMKTTLKWQRTLQALLVTGISIFGLAPAHAEDAVKVTAGNYVRAETNLQIKGYVETIFLFPGKFC